MQIPSFARKIDLLICCTLTIIAPLSACSPVSSPSLSEPTQTPQPTSGPLPTYTPFPTYTPYPTYTPLPTYTLPSTPPNLETVEPAQTQTPTPTIELVETLVAAEFQNCNDQIGARQKVRVENTTGSNASLYLYGPENYLCSIPPGTNQIYIVNGDYDLSALMCGDQLYIFGSHIINPTWVITLKCP